MVGTISHIYHINFILPVIIELKRFIIDVIQDTIPLIA